MRLIAFSGQGTQFVGMGKEFIERFAAARAVFMEVDRTLNYSISDIILNGPTATLCATEHAQVAIMCTSIAILRTLQIHYNFQIKEDDILIGNSLGEYTALCASGALTLQQCTQLLQARSKAMAKCTNPNHTMAAVIGMSSEDVHNILRNLNMHDMKCEISNDNCPGQIVVSGDREALEILKPYVKKMITLNVSGAFHSSYMKNAAEQMHQILNDVTFGDTKIRVISNHSLNIPPTKHDLEQQVCTCVRFREGVQLAHQLGCESFVEIGPQSILANMITKTVPIQGFAVCSLQDIEDNIGNFT